MKPGDKIIFAVQGWFGSITFPSIVIGTTKKRVKIALLHSKTREVCLRYVSLENIRVPDKFSESEEKILGEIKSKL